MHSALAQTLPSGAGYQIGDGAVPIDAPRRGVQGWATEVSVTTQATLTNNANYGDSNVRQGDLILEFIPALSFNREGGRLRVNGFVALDFVGYVDGTQVSSILPRADILANLEAIENLFFVDASIFAGQSVVNPYLPTSASGTNNLYTSTQARVAPYFRGNFGTYTTWQVRSDNTFTWTSQPDDPIGNAYYVRNLAEVIRAPTPLGWSVRLTNEITRIDEQVQPDQTLNTGIGTLDYAFTPQLTLGLRAGYETSTYTAEEVSGPIYGGSISWRPTPLSSLVGFWDQRFYGPSYSFQAVPPTASRRVLAICVSHAVHLSSSIAADPRDQQCQWTAQRHPCRALSGSNRTCPGGPGSCDAPGAATGAPGGNLHLQPEREYPDGRQRELGAHRRPQHARLQPLLPQDRVPAGCAHTAKLPGLQQQYSARRRHHLEPSVVAGVESQRNIEHTIDTRI